MKNKIGRSIHIKLAAVTLTLIVFGQTVVWADPLTDQLQRQQEQLRQDRNLLREVEDQREELEIRIEEIDFQIERLMSQIDDSKSQITQTEKDIKSTELEVKKTEEEVELNKELLGKRVRAMYKQGNSGYVTMLLDTKSMGDFISKLEWIRKIIDFDKKMIQQLKDKESELGKKKEELGQKREELVALKKSSEQKLVEIKESTKEQNKLIEEVRKQERMYASRVSASQTLVNATLRQIQQIRDAVPKYNPSRGAAPISDNAIIAYASNFLGTPYVWGGTTPNPGFDCSGFTRYVYAHFGVRLGRTTWDQIKNGVGISRDQLQPGDLVFFGRGGNPTHMGIYVGSNTYIHAPRRGDVVKISPMTRGDYITARRVK